MRDIELSEVIDRKRLARVSVATAIFLCFINFADPPEYVGLIALACNVVFVYFTMHPITLVKVKGAEKDDNDLE